MGRRHFDDYDANDWYEEHRRTKQNLRKRQARKQRHQAPAEPPAGPRAR